MAQKKAYMTKAGVKQFKPSLRWVEQSSETCEGFCLACGDTQSGVEPDARRYVCESCGKPKVYGGEELALMGLCF